MSGNMLPALKLGLPPCAQQRLARIATQLTVVSQQPPPAERARRCTCTTTAGGAEISRGQLTPLVERIHAFTKASNTRVAIMATGAGSHLIKSLLSVPGASSTVLEAVVPYAVEAQTEYLGYATHASVDRATARDFAETALQRATAMCEAAMTSADDGAPELLPVGLAVTASLATNRTRRGANRALVATAIRGQVTLFELSLQKEHRDREGEDICVTWTMVHALSLALSQASGITAPDVVLPRDLLDGADEGIAVTDVTPPADPVAALIAGDVKSVTLHPSGRYSVDCPFRGAVLAGSFNPLHEGHIGLLTAAAQATSQPMAFELALTNADKGTLDVDTVAQRVAQFGRGGVGEGLTLLLTMAPTFIDKTAALPGVAFVVGQDTAERLVMEKYYGGTLDGLQSAFESVAKAGCSFIVAGRTNSDSGIFETFDAEKECKAAGIDPGLFRTMSEEEFRMDISSSELRAKGKGLP